MSRSPSLKNIGIPRAKRLVSPRLGSEAAATIAALPVTTLVGVALVEDKPGTRQKSHT